MKLVRFLEEEAGNSLTRVTSWLQGVCPSPLMSPAQQVIGWHLRECGTWDSAAGVELVLHLVDHTAALGQLLPQDADLMLEPEDTNMTSSCFYRNNRENKRNKSKINLSPPVDGFLVPLSVLFQLRHLHLQLPA